MQEQAISSPQSVTSLNVLLNIVKPTAKVRILSVLVTIRGHIKLFHVVTNVKMPNVAMTGNAHGRATLKKVCQTLHPSNTDASSSSFEKLKKYCLIKNTPNPPNNPGTINA